MATRDVAKFPPPNKAAIEFLFKRACHAVSAQSPADMSDPASVSRVLGELFANMHEEETRWVTELKSCRGWVCDMPAQCGGGALSCTVVNPVVSRLQVTGNSKWSTPEGHAVEMKNDDDRAEMEKLMLRFAQMGSLLEVQPDAAAPNAADATAAGGGAAASTNLATGGAGVSSSSSSSATRITIMRDTRSEMKVFQLRENNDTNANLGEILALVQRVNVNNQSQSAVLAGMSVI